MKSEFYSWLNTLSLDEISELRNDLRNIHSNKFHDSYVVVEVHNSAGNISSRIEAETKFECRHSIMHTGTIGTNNILIPRELYNDSIREDLISRYSNV